tara:strand:+ start:1225 stop:2394 length:1170 start_codon:yes stop_codon:yes gene_type:complete
MAITNLDSLLRQQAMNDRIRASASRLNPFFGQQQRSGSFSIPTGGFMGQNQIGGSSSVNTYRAPKPELAPEELEEQELQERAAQYQQGVAEFNLGQKEAELEKRTAEAEEIASGRNMLNGEAVTRSEMDRYLQGVEQSGAKAQANFSRENPFYAAAKSSMPRAPQPDQFSNDQDYQSAISEYLSPANKQAREQEFTRKLNQSRSNALTNSINQFRNDPMGYLLGGGKEGSSTYSPDDLMSYLGQANQLFKATGQEGNFMDFILGNSSTGQGGSQPRYNPGSNYASQGFASPRPTSQLPGGQQVIGFSSPRPSQPTGIPREDAIALTNQFISDQKSRSTDDYVFRNLTPSERDDPNLGSVARMKARRENAQEKREAEKAFNAIKRQFRNR